MAPHIKILKKLNVPKKLKQKFDEKTLKQTLCSFNKMSGGSYFFLDHYHEKLIIGTSESRILCGYSKQFAEQEGFDFFKRIFNNKELEWLMRLWQLSSDFFFSLDEDECEDYILHFDINATTKHGEELILHHKIVPYQLCDNGNLWLALGCVSPSSLKEFEYNACMINRATQTKYDLINDAFVPSKISPLTLAEKEILLLLGKSMSESDICKELDIKKGKYHHTKTKLFLKLNVNAPGGAIQKAYHLGLI